MLPKRWLVFLALLSAGPSVRAEPVDYIRHIKPMLAAKCAACHGTLKQQSGLRLDAAQLLRAGGDGGPVIAPGKADESLLWQRVTAADGTPRMPPEGEGEPLTAEQLRQLKSWIEQGASSPAEELIPEDPRQYWSYRAPTRPPLPAVRHKTWVRTPLDAFVAAELERQGLAPRHEAPREVWLRRVYLDLIGLPPTREELLAFLADERSDAWERVVDDLLQRPAYGERWGRHWMDVWRYSDWYGSRGINEIRYSQRHIWRWRDWIVESINRDQSYDRMVIEMLAGDEVAPADPDVLRATGFLGRNWYKFDRNVWMFETVEQTSQAFLAMTLKCARCHDHKFSPITQEEYYRFRAFFEPHDVRTDPLQANAAVEKDATLGQVLKEGVARVYDKVVDARTYLFQRGDSRYPDESRGLEPGVPAALGSLELVIEPVALPVEAYYPQLRPELAAGLVASADEALKQARGKVEQQRMAVAKAEAELAAWSPPAEPPVRVFLDDDFAEARSDVWKVVSGDWAWADGRLKQRTVGNFATLVTLADHPRDFEARVRYRTLAAGTYRSVGFSFDQDGIGESQDVYTSVNDNASSVQAFHRQGGKQTYPAAGIVKTPLKVGEEIIVEVTVRGQSLAIRVNGEPKLDYVMPVARRAGKFALWVHNGTAEFLEVEIREWVSRRDDLQRAVQTARDQLELASSQVLVAEAEFAATRARLAAERAKHSGESASATQPVAQAAARAEKQVAVAKAAVDVLRAEQHLNAVVRSALATGNESEEPPLAAEARKQLAEANAARQAAIAACDMPGEAYSPLGELYPATSSGRRLALARWIADPGNPRTSRVAVNHIWLRHFGHALVPSVANFGLNGERPSHPQLLDWLAAELVEHRWRMKPLHRQIVLSAAYRQSSSETAPGAWPVTMAPAAVDANNRLLWRMNSRRMEAEVVRDAVLAAASQLDRTPGGPEIPESEGQTNARRSLYFRLTPNEKMAFLETFDAADPNGCYRRKESVVPHQALALMNSGLALESARTLAETLSESLVSRADRDRADGDRADAATQEAFVTAAFQQILTRHPTASELAACLEFLGAHSLLFQEKDLSAFPAGAGGRRPPSTSPARRARENLVHVLFNHNDFVTIR